MLYLETGGHAIIIVGVVTAEFAVGEDIKETEGVVGIGRTPPPRGSITCIVMLILYLAVPR